MAARLGAGDDEHIRAGLGVLDGVFFGARERTHGNAFRAGPPQHEVRRHAEGVDHELHRMVEGGVQHHRGAFLAQVVAEVVAQLAFPQPLRVDTVARQDGFHVRLVLRRNPRLDVCRGEGLLLAVEAGGHQQVHTVGLAVHVVVQPAQLDVQGFGRVPHGAEHPHAAGVAHRGDHIAAVAEREQRELDAEHVADRAFHSSFTCRSELAERLTDSAGGGGVARRGTGFAMGRPL